ncbi:hypothetical protein B0H14DRAFT_3857057 [Mycena olivaceomarginata]|nr:hypothetical protein B0H14DRAFT_3857057 [Mycena olivaceomarginata]
MENMLFLTLARTQSRPMHTVRGSDDLISKFGLLPAYKKYVAAEKNCPDTNEAPTNFPPTPSQGATPDKSLVDVMTGIHPSQRLPIVPMQGIEHFNFGPESVAPDYTEPVDTAAERDTGVFINHDDEVEEMKAALGNFDYIADDGNWGIDTYCRAVRIATDYFAAMEE